MTKLVWSKGNSYVDGLSKGVLYLGYNAVPWSGLVSVDESNDDSSESLYFDGKKVGDSLVLGDLSLAISAFTFPPELSDYDGTEEILTGVFINDGNPVPFCFSYQVDISDSNGNKIGKEIHIWSGVTAVPAEVNNTTLNGEINLEPFGWNATITPESLDGVRPTGHIIINSMEVPDRVMTAIEARLYGSETGAPNFSSFVAFFNYVVNYAVVDITDNGDGTFFITAPDDLVTLVGDHEYRIDDVTLTQIDDHEFEISDTTGDE